MTEVVASVMLVLGSLLAFVAAIGLLRFNDVFSRMQATSKPATLGILLTLGGAALVVTTRAPAVAKLLLVIVLQFMTVPISAHLVGRAVYRAGAKIRLEGGVDELAEYLSSQDD
ncbi:MAG: Na+/H+ antiporter subunit G [Acidimicrobiia bacterium]|nr:Na+/H+ antiporter subunit G [Acidimicrobiia bacterium]